MRILRFGVLQGGADALARRCGKISTHLLTAYFLNNVSAKNYQNRDHASQLLLLLQAMRVNL